MYKRDSTTIGLLHDSIISATVTDLRLNLLIGAGTYSENHIIKLNKHVHDIITLVPNLSLKVDKDVEPFISKFTRGLEADSLYSVVADMSSRLLYVVIDCDTLTLPVLAKKVAHSFAYIPNSDIDKIAAMLEKYPLLLTIRIFEMHKVFTHAAKK